MNDTNSAQFLHSRKSAACASIPQNPYFLFLSLVGLNPYFIRDSIRVRMRSSQRHLNKRRFLVQAAGPVHPHADSVHERSGVPVARSEHLPTYAVKDGLPGRYPKGRTERGPARAGSRQRREKPRGSGRLRDEASDKPYSIQIKKHRHRRCFWWWDV